MPSLPVKPDTQQQGLAGRWREFRGWAALAQQQSGKGLLRQIGEIAAIRQAGGKCGLSDYYWYRLYDDAFQQGRGARDFLGWRLQGAFSRALNPRHAVLPAWDKLAFMALASAAGLPVAPLRAYFHRTRFAHAAFGEHLDGIEAVRAFLRDNGNYPLFAKPAYSQQGIGSAYLRVYDHACDSVVPLDGKPIPLAEFLQRIEHSVDPRYHHPECGFVFQTPLAPAAEIHALTHWPAISGVRIVCLNETDGKGVRPIRAVWKVATPPNHVDNFSRGKYGNLLADVDLWTGKIGRVVNGFWPEAASHLLYPSTGAVLEGFQLPRWDDVLNACRQGGAVFPLMRIHHWDFALTDHGPVMLELNDLGATELLQIHGHGLLTEETREFLRRHASRNEPLLEDILSTS